MTEIIFQGVTTLKIMKKITKIPIFEFLYQLQSVNSCIVGRKDISGQMFQTNFYIANFQGVETLKIT